MKSYTSSLLTTEQVEQVKCPACGAGRGKPCTGTSDGVKSHMARMKAARAKQAERRKR